MGDESTSEWLDVLSPGGAITGQATRYDVHSQGLWHRTFHCLGVRSGLPARVVLQRRGFSGSFPGKLDLTASGHLMAGEQPHDGIRELEEETGLSFTADELVPVGVKVIVDESEHRINRERVHVFFVSTDAELEAFRPPVDEIAGFVEVAAADLLALLTDDRSTQSIPANEIGFEPSGRWGRASAVELGRHDLIDGYDHYLVTIMVMAERFAAGVSPIAV